MVSILLHVCYNNEKKIEVKPDNSRNETGQPERNRATTGMKPSRLGSSLETFFGHYMVTTRSLQSAFHSVSLRFEFFMNGSSFEPKLGSFWSRMLRGSRFGFATFRI